MGVLFSFTIVMASHDKSMPSIRDLNAIHWCVDRSLAFNSCERAFYTHNSCCCSLVQLDTSLIVSVQLSLDKWEKTHRVMEQNVYSNFNFLEKIHFVELFTDENPEIGLVFWGSCIPAPNIKLHYCYLLHVLYVLRSLNSFYFFVSKY